MPTPQTGAARPLSAHRFSLGRLVATPGALAALFAAGTSPLPYLQRHAAGDWGECGAEDWRANDRALRLGERLFSVDRLADGTRLWIITEADRAATMILLPEEY
jgi:hypothetical protein